MSRTRLIGAALLSALFVPASAWAQYSQMAQPQTWTGGGGGGGYGVYSGGFGGGGYGGGYGAGGYGGFGGGGYGSGAGNYGMSPANLSLIARQTEQVHGQMADLLEQLRRIQGQQVAVATPFHTLNDNFYERIGVDFGFNITGGNPNGTGSRVVGLDPTGMVTPNGDLEFRQGGAGSALPPFGGHDPATDATIGAAILGSPGSLFFNLFAGQGNTRNHVSQVPSVVLQNGTRGTFSDTSQMPFVTSVIPVVGGYRVPRPYYPVMPPTTYSVLQERIRRLQAQNQQRQKAAAAGGAAAPAPAAAGAAAAPRKTYSPPEPKLSKGHELSLKLLESKGSTAGHGDLSVAEIKRRRAAAKAHEAVVQDAAILEKIERGRGAEAAGKPNVAKIYYQQAATRAKGEQKQQLLQKIESLE
jgi:hypothetical protein